MNQILEETLAHNTGDAFQVRKSQILRFVGRTTVDVVFFNLHDLRERFDQARTKVLQGKIFITIGDKLYSKSNNPMFTIVDDTLPLGKHDIEFGMCSTSSYERFKGDLYDVYDVKKVFGIERDQVPDHGCWENLTSALEPWHIPREDIPSPLNVFQESRIDGTKGTIEMVHKILEKPARFDVRAEMDCLVGVSACPWVGCGKPVTVSIHEP
jgi:uncharacterized protein YcgI (DUF1989 family)